MAHKGTEPHNKGQFRLNPDEATLKAVRGLGALQATERECAAYFDVGLRTWQEFKARDPAVQNAYDAGSGSGKVSLRRAQYDLALGEKDATGKYTRPPNATMCIWLGKQELGQRDQTELVGANGGPIQHEHGMDLSLLSDQELTDLEFLIRKGGAASPKPDDGASDSPGMGETTH